LLDTAINSINSQRATIGASINQMTYAADNLTNISANASASRSTVMDTDYATASTNLAKNQIIQQAATAMLAQANQQPQAVLSLLK
jgi:flagellin